MSQLITPPPSSEASYEHGMRTIVEQTPNGPIFHDIPLTLEDCLYPEMGDLIMHNSWHDDARIYLKQVLRGALAHDPTCFVHSDGPVHFGVPGMRNLGPDIIVFLNVKDPHRDWGVFPVIEQGAKIVLAAEIVSIHNRTNDVEKKIDLYHRAGVPFYIIIDQLKEDGPRTLRAFQDTPDGYEELTLPAHGRLHLDSLGIAVALAIEDNDLACYDTKTGERIRTWEQKTEALVETERQLTVVTDERDLAKQKLKQEADARAAAEDKVRELEALVTQLRQKPGKP